MLSFYSSVMENGGDGIFLRQPESNYENGRSKTFYTLKVIMNSI